MDRFFVDKIEKSKAYILSKDEVAHIHKTLRMNVGDEIEIFDGKGKAYSGAISSIARNQIEVDLIEPIASGGELNVEIIVYQGIPKAQKMDWIVQKLTELGVAKVVPVKFERCVRTIDEKEEKLIGRWQKIAIEACKQSKRSFIPVIEKQKNLSELKQEIEQNCLTLLCFENEDRLSIKKFLRQDMDIKLESRAKIGLIIGPEGGFSDYEKESMESLGAISVSLGNTILRTETASVVGASIICYELGWEM